ncbi:hypothetical protein Avbf_07484 [Armadillidium vulgare]|nr:hypothetical protein Avbf_07484 [Armadillidium vulgare]
MGFLKRVNTCSNSDSEVCLHSLHILQVLFKTLWMMLCCVGILRTWISLILNIGGCSEDEDVEPYTLEDKTYASKLHTMMKVPWRGHFTQINSKLKIRLS